MLMGDSDIRQNDGCECDSCVRHCGPDPQSLLKKEAFQTPSIRTDGLLQVCFHLAILARINQTNSGQFQKNCL
jgi:hypothetical protein